MKKGIIVVMIMVLSAGFTLPCLAQENYAIEIIRTGLLGAGAGAIGGAASGAKGSDIWKGALAGAGTNIIGGALLDTITQKQTTRVQSQTYAPAPQGYVVQTQPIRTQYASYNPTNVYSTQDPYEEAYQKGYSQGYKEGYIAGLKDGIREVSD